MSVSWFECEYYTHKSTLDAAFQMRFSFIPISALETQRHRNSSPYIVQSLSKFGQMSKFHKMLNHFFKYTLHNLKSNKKNERKMKFQKKNNNGNLEKE